MSDQRAHGHEDGKCTTAWCEYSEASVAHAAKRADSQARLAAVIAENNALRKNTEKLTVQMKETREALARAQTAASKASGRAEDFASALRSQRATHTLELDAEWNAALEKAADVAVIGACGPGCGHAGCQCLRAARDKVLSLKREVKT